MQTETWMDVYNYLWHVVYGVEAFAAFTASLER